RVDEPSISISPATRDDSTSLGLNPAPFTPSESSRFLPWWLGVFASSLLLLSGLRRAAAWAAASRMFHELTRKIPGNHNSCATGLSSGDETVAASSHSPAMATVPVICTRPGVA